MNKLLLFMFNFFIVNFCFSLDCKYLLEIDGDYWIANEENGLMKRLTFDGKTKNSYAFWSFDGSVIAYSPAKRYDEQTQILFLNNEGEELLRYDTYIGPKTDNIVRKIDKIGWIDKGKVYLDMDVGPNGGIIEIIDLDLGKKQANTFKCISYFGCCCSLSKDLNYLACLNSPNPLSISIYNTNLKGIFQEEYNIYEDDNPIWIYYENINLVGDFEIKFSLDNKNLYISNESFDYQIDLERCQERIKKITKEECKEKGFSEEEANLIINNKRLERVYKVCNIEKIEAKKRMEKKNYLKIKKGKKEIEAEVLDMYCEEQIKYCSPKVF